MKFLYTTVPGRLILSLVKSSGGRALAAGYLHTNLSRIKINKYIKENGIDMTDFAGQEYKSFADFFARKKDSIAFDSEANAFISPCDGLLSVYEIKDNLSIPMKGSHYRVQDLIPDEKTAERYNNGLCFIFRLQASDYHHFCFVDDCTIGDTHFLDGQLHSVQPIAIQTVPVYRINRRWWTELETVHFGHMVQTEIGALLVGGVTILEKGDYLKGTEMGNFELCGSTIAVFMEASVKNTFSLAEKFLPALGGNTEVPMKIGEKIGEVHA